MKLSSHRLLVLLILHLLLSGCEQSTPEARLDIPDPYFLEALIEQGVDRDKDGRISIPEAEATLSLRLSPSRISDLSGLEAFVHLDTLIIRMNPLLGLDLTQNSSLSYLECTGCELSDLDLSQNPKLSYLDCSGGASMGNSLTRLEVSANPDLEYLNCAENQLTTLALSKQKDLLVLNCGRNLIQELDVSVNSKLTHLMCNNNLLTSIEVSANQSLQKLITCGNQLLNLDVSSNSSLKVLGVDNMSTLTEVCVWTQPFPPEGVTVLKEFSPHVFFSTNCSH